MSDARTEARQPTRLTQITCEHPYEATQSTAFNSGRDVEIKCGKCGSEVRVAVYRILIARDLAIWARHQVRQSEPPGSPEDSPSRLSMKVTPMQDTPEFGPPWPADYPSPLLRHST